MLKLKTHWCIIKGFLWSACSLWVLDLIKHTVESQNAAGAQQPVGAWCHYQQLKMNHEVSPEGFLLNKAYNWLRQAGEKLCWLIQHLQREYYARGNRQPKSKWGLFVHVSTRLYSMCCKASPLCISVVFFVCVSADFSVCSAVIWTPFCCWRISTKSAPCCCRVRGRTSLSRTLMMGMNQEKHH